MCAHRSLGKTQVCCTRSWCVPGCLFFGNSFSTTGLRESSEHNPSFEIQLSGLSCTLTLSSELEKPESSSSSQPKLWQAYSGGGRLEASWRGNPSLLLRMMESEEVIDPLSSLHPHLDVRRLKMIYLLTRPDNHKVRPLDIIWPELWSLVSMKSQLEYKQRKFKMSN